MKYWPPLLVILLSLGAPSRLLAGDPEVSNFRESVFVSDAASLTEITRLGWAPDGSERLFVTRFRGEVRIIKQGQLLPTPFARIEPIFVSGECGLLGFCFDPNFAVNRFIYFFATVSPDEQQVIRFTDRDDIGVEKTVLVRNLPTKGSRHNGGAITIGPDGKLYWGIGDNGASVGTKANLTSLASKIGRANLDGTPANDNPFNDGAGPNNDYIWARGFRNPFAIFFQPIAGQLWVNDVGGDYEQIFAVDAGDHGGWDFYEANQPEGYLKPVIKYRTNGTDTRAIAPGGAVRQDNLTTLSTIEPHGFLKGEKIKLSGISPASFDGDFFVASVLSSTRFTVRQVGVDEAGGGGSVASLKLGGSVTGGTFYNSTAFPREYWGNLFFGDYNSGRLLRAALDPNNEVISVDTFATAIRQFLDVCVGPDGALYYAGYNSIGAIYRMAYLNPAPKIVVQPTTLQMAEGGRGILSVRLAAAPISPVTVNIAPRAGGEMLGVGAVTNLTFSAGNWQSAQRVNVEAMAAPDGQHSKATLTLSAPGFETQEVGIHAIDQANSGLILSSSFLDVAEGGSGSFTVRLAEAPAAELAVAVTLAGATSNLSIVNGQTLLFTPANFSTPQTVTIAAPEDADVAADSGTAVIAAVGHASRKLVVTVSDNDPLAPAIVSVAPGRAVLGAAFNYTVAAQGNPAPRFSLVQAPPGMSIDPLSGQLWWVPGAIGEFNVVLQAANGHSLAAMQSFVLAVAPDSPPQARITKPVEGEVVSGKMSEWFGDGLDDVGTLRADFYIDGVLAYSDVNNSGHFHFGGDHLRWDTTLLSDGPHRLRMVVHDSKGQTGTSEVNVVVSNTVVNQPPSVALTHPANGAAFVSPPVIFIEASATDADQGIGKVEMLANDVKIGEALQPPYSLLWSKPAPGIYTLQARAIDRLESAALSPPVRIEVLEHVGLEADVIPRGPGRGDGIVDESDWMQVGRFVVGLDAVSDTNEFLRIDSAPRDSTAGLDRGDGLITVRDWVQMGRYKSGLDPLTPAGGPMKQAGEEFVPAEAKGFPDGAGRAAAWVGFGRCVFFLGESNTISVRIEAQGNENAIGLGMQFDPLSLRYLGTELGRNAAGATMQVNANEAGAGRLGLAVILPAGQAFAAGTREIARLTFLAQAPDERSIPLALSDYPVFREIADAAASRLPGIFQDGIAEIKSGLSIAAVLGAEGRVQIRCEGLPERTYSVQVSSDLATWTTLLSLTADANGFFTFEESEVLNAASRFYRIVHP